jgi:hypothetical protein
VVSTVGYIHHFVRTPRGRLENSADDSNAWHKERDKYLNEVCHLNDSESLYKLHARGTHFDQNCIPMTGIDQLYYLYTF